MVCFDTETVSRHTGETEVMTLRCWAAVLRDRTLPAGTRQAVQCFDGTGAGELADVLELAASLHGEAWALAHNVGFDLAVTMLPDILCGRGWRPTFVNIGDESCVFTLAKDGGRLVVADSWSWLRCSLRQAAREAGLRKPRLPGRDSDLAQWQARCAADVRILDQLMDAFADWWDRLPAGRLSVTSASCGWQTLRARTLPGRVLVGPDETRTPMQRDAIHGGRKEVWQVGEITGRWVEDWDITAAHLTTMAKLPLPCRPLPRARLGKRLDPLSPPDGVGSICRLIVDTRQVCAPCRVDGDVWWTVGRFETTVTSAELPLVLDLADRVRLVAYQLHELTMDLEPWGRWCLELLADQTGATPAVVRRVAKGWGRSVPGRFALRTRSLIGQRPATRPGWHIETGHDLATGQPIEVVSINGIESTYRLDTDGRDINPAVLAFVEGHVRHALGRALSARDPARLVQCNTDGWWEERHPSGWPVPAAVTPQPYRVVRKAVTNRVGVRGANHVEAPGDRRLAGIPADARAADDGRFEWRDWPTLRWQLQNSNPGEYVRPARAGVLDPHYCRRWVLDTGRTLPVSSTWTARTGNRLLGWSVCPGRQPSDVLHGHQVPVLRALSGL